MLKTSLEDHKEHFTKWIDLYSCCGSIISFITPCIPIDATYPPLYSTDLSSFEKLPYILGCSYILLPNLFESFYTFLMIMSLLHIHKNIINFVKLNCNVDTSWLFAFSRARINNTKFEIAQIFHDKMFCVDQNFYLTKIFKSTNLMSLKQVKSF